MENNAFIKILLGLQAVLIIAVLVVTIISLDSSPVTGICSIVTIAFVIMYGLFLYKKPHGNLLKYAMLLFAFSMIFSTAMNTYNTVFMDLIKLICAGALCYTSGRLDRVEQNKYIFAGIGILLIIYWAIYVFSGVSWFVFFRRGSNIIIFVTLSLAYFLRYKQHKEAGIMDYRTK